MFSVEEVKQQIQDLEGVQVQIRVPEDALFKKAYQEFYKEKMPDDATVSELKLRVDTYLNTQKATDEEVQRWKNIWKDCFTRKLQNAIGASAMSDIEKHSSDTPIGELKWLSYTVVTSVLGALNGKPLEENKVPLTIGAFLETFKRLIHGSVTEAAQFVFRWSL